MWKALKFFSGVLKAVFWTVFVCAILGILTLLVARRGIPSSLIDRMTDKIKMKDFYLRVEHASYTLHNGLRLSGVKLLPRGKQGEAFLSAEDIYIDFSLAPGTPWENRLEKLTIVKARFPELPPKKHHKENEPKKPPFIPNLPKTKPFELVLDNPNILGIHAKSLTGIACVREHSVSVRDVTILWPDSANEGGVNATLLLDFETRLVQSVMKGQAYPNQIMPLLSPKGVDAKVVIREVNKFQEISRPVNADANLSINIDNADFDLKLGIDAGPCTYNGVKMDYVKGSLEAFETNITTTVIIHPLDARSSTGPLSGRVLYCDDDNRVIFHANAGMDLPQLFDIIGVLNEGELDVIRCKIPPVLEASGIVCAAKRMGSVTNDAAGKISLERGSILNFEANDITSDFRLKGYSAIFDNINGTPRHGGKVSGWANFSFPDYCASQTVFQAGVNFENVDLLDISHAVNVTNTHLGKVGGKALLHSTTGKDALQKLCGAGHVNFKEGIITQIPLFAGFTAYLAKTVPGISSVVDQSAGSMDFVISNGVLYTENALVEGSVFSIKGRGTYDLVNDKLAFTVRANIFRQKTIVGKITHFITFPFTSLLLEFKVFGPLEKTDWSYVSIISRITDTSASLFSSKKGKDAEKKSR